MKFEKINLSGTFRLVQSKYEDKTSYSVMLFSKNAKEEWTSGFIPVVFNQLKTKQLDEFFQKLTKEDKVWINLVEAWLRFYKNSKDEAVLQIYVHLADVSKKQPEKQKVEDDDNPF